MPCCMEKNGLAWVMPATKALRAGGEPGRQIQWEIAMRPGKRKALPDTPDGRLQERIEQVKASIRARLNIRSGSSRTSSA